MKKQLQKDKAQHHWKEQVTRLIVIVKVQQREKTKQGPSRDVTCNSTI